jgi:hypothetical protein
MGVHEVGKGDQTKFWMDIWLRTVPLRVRFHELFLICSKPETLVERVVKDRVWRIRFRRQLS